MSTPDLFDPVDIVGIDGTPGTLTTPGTRGHRGRFLRTLSQAETDAEAARLRSEGKSYRKIADVMGCSVHAAHDRVQRALAAVPSEAVEAIRAIEGERLTEALAVALVELRRDHVLVSHGRIVKDDNGVPLIDHGGKLAAVRELVRVSESYRKLMGADLPIRVDQHVTVEHTTTLDAEIERLMAQVDSVEQGGVEHDGRTAG